MTVDYDDLRAKALAEAWRIIDACRHWNTGQQSINGAKGEQEVLDAKRAALAQAWRTVGQAATLEGRIIELDRARGRTT